MSAVSNRLRLDGDKGSLRVKTVQQIIIYDGHLVIENISIKENLLIHIVEL